MKLETFGTAGALTCGAVGEDDVECTADATWHVIIEAEPSALFEDTLACDTHKRMMDEAGVPFLCAHPYRLDCSSELAYFYPDLNECFIGDPDADGV